MPRIVGFRERRDRGSYYDTNIVEPGQVVRFFQTVPKFDPVDPAKWRGFGARFKTNMSAPGQVSSDQPFMLMGIGARLIGKRYEEEELLLDHLNLCFWMGDMPQANILGPHASMLRHVYTKEELESYQRLADEPPNEYEDEKRRPPPYRAPGYLFLRSVIIPVRQCIGVDVTGAETLPEAVTMRVHLFGVQIRDVA